MSNRIYGQPPAAPPAPHAAPIKACRADLCTQGRRVCPCPQACELPADQSGAQPAAPLRAVVLSGLAHAAFAGALILLVVLASSA